MEANKSIIEKIEIDSICKELEQFFEEVKEEAKRIKREIGVLAQVFGLSPMVKVEIIEGEVEEEAASEEVAGKYKEAEFCKLYLEYIKRTANLRFFRVFYRYSTPYWLLLYIEKSREILGVKLVRTIEVSIHF